MLNKILLVSLFILLSLIGFSQEKIEDGLTAKERAFSDSIAAVNQASQENAAAMIAYNDGIKAFQVKNYSVAIEHFDKAIAGSPDFVDAHFNKGMAEMEGGNEKNAIITFDRVLELESKNSKSYFHHG